MQLQGHILVIEPNDLILGLFERWLGEAGYSVVVGSARTLSQAVGERREPSLVIIDVPTPRKAKSIIDSVRDVYSSPILLLSSAFERGMGSSSSLALELAVRYVLPKPFTRAELLSAVTESIEGQ